MKINMKSFLALYGCSIPAFSAGAGTLRGGGNAIKQELETNHNNNQERELLFGACEGCGGGGGGGEDGEDGGFTEPPTPKPTQRPTDSPTSSPTMSAKFDSNASLRAVVNEYMNDAEGTEAKYGSPIGEWDVSDITNFGNVFAGKHRFNADISGWDTSKATSMRSMFLYAKSFNQDISSWDTSKVEDMSYMFNYAQSFSQGYLCWAMADNCVQTDMFDSTGGFNSVGCLYDFSVDNISNGFQWNGDTQLIVSSDDTEESSNIFQEVEFTNSCPSQEVDWLNWAYTIGISLNSDTTTVDACRFFCYHIDEIGGGGASCEFAYYKNGACTLFSKDPNDTAAKVGKKDCAGTDDGGVFLVPKFQLVTTVSDATKPVGTIGQDFIDYFESVTETTYRPVVAVDGTSYHCTSSNIADCMYDTKGFSCEDVGPSNQHNWCQDYEGNWRWDRTNDCVHKWNSYDMADIWNEHEGCGTVKPEFSYELTIHESQLGGVDSETFLPGFRDTVIEILKGVRKRDGIARLADGGGAGCNKGYRKVKIHNVDESINVHTFPTWVDVSLWRWAEYNGEWGAHEVAEFDYHLETTANFPGGAPTDDICHAGVGIGIGAAGLAVGLSLIPFAGTAAGAVLGIVGVAQAAYCA